MELLAALPLFDFSWVSQPEAWIALLTLTVLEIVLGIDNIVFISILVDKLPAAQQPRARFIGLALAMVTRILLLFSITWVMSLKDQLFSVFGHGISGKDLILIGGGLFLLFKSTHEIHAKIEGDPEGDVEKKAAKGAAFGMILFQIAMLDIVFSLDSVITAVGMAKSIMVMVIAVMIAVGFMMIFAGAVSNFINRHPTIKMLALSFLILIGVMLMIEGLAPAKAHDLHLKNYIYFAMAFSIMVELLNIRASRKKGHGAKHPEIPNKAA
ncbi:TerC family protein [Verrucomicrobium sp. BvORR034]|uniref:TerC family protein n=1 Tax=Verrucomicrobium sp. BvORR034 TaxID=1396418 RepID=UPI000678991D|nr:TerC family protein [Verrucomicrobium sp. BvORR034]